MADGAIVIGEYEPYALTVHGAVVVGSYEPYPLTVHGALVIGTYGELVRDNSLFFSGD